VSSAWVSKPRIHADLAEQGMHVGRKRVARLMRKAELAGVSRRRFVTTTVKGSGRRAPDLVDRNFTAERPNLLWVADITYCPTWSGFLYLAIVLDAFSRRIIGQSERLSLMCGWLPHCKGKLTLQQSWSGALMCPAFWVAVHMTAGS
jgi:transposase InsO family protein